jgi:diguanylate cyclase (GGDEF)-like protein/PAS domain S-box-containing protein
MGAYLSVRDGTALFGLLAESSEDIVVKADRAGFIDPASFGLEQLGLRLGDLLIAPHLADLAAARHGAAVRGYHDAVVAGVTSVPPVEFKVAAKGDRRWYRLQLRAVHARDGQTAGTVGIMRCIDERLALEEELFAAAVTDPLTGLANRGAMISMLGHLCEEEEGGAIALFTLERLRSLNLHYGQAAGDQMLRAFADLMRTVLRRDHILGRFGGETFAVLMPRDDRWRAGQIASDLVATFTALSCGDAGEVGPVAVSGAVAGIAPCIDATLRAVDAALVRARATGGRRVETATSQAVGIGAR